MVQASNIFRPYRCISDFLFRETTKVVLVFEQRGVATCCTELSSGGSALASGDGCPSLRVLGVIRLRPSFPRTSGGV